MRSPKSVFLILSTVVVMLAGCAPDAPHDNNLDPRSPDYRNTGVLTGRVLTLGLPYTGISDALVQIQQTGEAQFTSSDGSFDFQSAPSGNVTLVITKPSYLADTVRIELPVGGTCDTLIHIDALPQISGAGIVTTKIDQWWPGPVYSGLVSANVFDPDGIGNIDSVYVMVDSLSFTMNYSVTYQNFQVRIDATQLPDQDLQWLVGKEMNVYAVDKVGGLGESAGFYISRIIEPEPVPTSPTGLDTTAASPVLDWNPPNVSYDYTYQLQVVRLDAGTQTVVWSQSGLNSSYVSYTYPGVLPSGTYFWTAAIVDDYGNSSRSKEASFVVP